MGGLQVRFLRSKDQTKGSLDMFEMAVQPAARMPMPHYHETWDETVYGLSGTTTWRINGRDTSVGPGQTAFIPRGTVHIFRNDTDVAASCLCVLTPGVLGPDYFREIAAWLATSNPDPADMKADHAATRSCPEREWLTAKYGYATYPRPCLPHLTGPSPVAEISTIVGLISAATALVASVTGPLVTFHVGRTQVRAAVLSANRQRWIDGFRGLIAEFCSQIGRCRAGSGQAGQRWQNPAVCSAGEPASVRAPNPHLCQNTAHDRSVRRASSGVGQGDRTAAYHTSNDALL